MRRFVLLAMLALALAGCPGGRRVPQGAVLLYDVDFSAPEQVVGNEARVFEVGREQTYPSKLPSEVFFGHPLVVPKLCGLDKQPVQLAVSSGTQGQEGLQFLLDPRYGRFHVELDICVERLEPPPLPAQAAQLLIFLDLPDAYALGFLSGGEIGVIDPKVEPDTANAPRPIGHFETGKPLHVDLDADLEKLTWRVSLDGKPAFDGSLRASAGGSVRVLLRGNPANAAAFDNLLVWAEHDLTPADETASPPVTGPEQ